MRREGRTRNVAAHRLGARPAIDRRLLLASAAATMVASGFPAARSTAQAAPHRIFRHGEFEITVLSDGNLVTPPPALAVNAEPEALRAALALAGHANERIEPPCNVTLIRSRTDVILVDAGAGPHFVPTAGRLLANMEKAGIDPNSVTKVVYTHAHPDHLWGTLDDFDDAPNFPNASYVMSAAEWNFWSAEDAAARLPDDRKFFAASTRRILAAIKDRTAIVTPGQDIVPGLRALSTAGHMQATSRSNWYPETTRC